METTIIEERVRYLWYVNNYSFFLLPWYSGIITIVFTNPKISDMSNCLMIYFVRMSTERFFVSHIRILFENTLKYRDIIEYSQNSSRSSDIHHICPTYRCLVRDNLHS